eukprot:TRINITY_DN6428_c0_g1_i1.p1 TRINITY_DN6428_c0_g1~~TRINITY_DN6428_c0_g1_i1.p1  ORF type:complete len:348 (-),score=65.60 TRINITY_DN6428_c0_g1_i1:53-1096(-)
MLLHPKAHTDHPVKVAVLGGGSFGTAIATVLARKGHNVVMLVRREEQCNTINQKHHNTPYLHEFVLPHNVTATLSPQQALENAEYVVSAIPCQHTFDALKSMKDLVPPTAPVISVSKGLYMKTLEMMCDVIPAALERDQPLAFLSGPSFARELMEKHPTTVVVASKSKDVALKVQDLFLSLDFRVYLSDDYIGVEVGGALKNVVAVASGIVQGLGFGTNSMAAVVTRGCGELVKLGRALGAQPSTLAGLSGYGDLMLTCFGSLSRNLTVGRKLGEGLTLDQILQGMKEVAEGVYTARAARELAAKMSIPRSELPIIHMVADIVDGHVTAREAVTKLMSLPVSTEFSH